MLMTLNEKLVAWNETVCKDLQICDQGEKEDYRTFILLNLITY